MVTLTYLLTKNFFLIQETDAFVSLLECFLVVFNLSLDILADGDLLF